MSIVKKIILRNESDMERFAKSFAKNIKPNDVIELIGDLGSGKTFFARALGKSFGGKNISSPSFVIKNEYAGKEFKIYHFDFYRLDDPGIVQEELSESLSSGGLVIIEWADSVKGILPTERYKIHFKVISNNSRELTIYK